MNAKQINDLNETDEDYGVQWDASGGQGHCWRNVADLRTTFVREEILCWIIEDNATAGDEFRASNGEHYRIDPRA